MFVLNEGKYLRRFSLSNKLKGLNLKRSRKFTDDIESLVFTEGFLKKLFGIIDTAFRDILLSKTYSVELFKDCFLNLRSDTSRVGDLKSKFLNLFLF